MEIKPTRSQLEDDNDWQRARIKELEAKVPEGFYDGKMRSFDEMCAIANHYKAALEGKKDA